MLLVLAAPECSPQVRDDDHSVSSLAWSQEPELIGLGQSLFSPQEGKREQTLGAGGQVAQSIVERLS